jgi:L-lactate dehydrogenase
VLSVSSLVKGLYGIEDVYLSLPTVLHRGGVERVIHLELNEEEEMKLKDSARVLHETIGGLEGLI